MPDESPVFTWRGHAMPTINDMIDVLTFHVHDELDGLHFMAAYKTFCPDHAYDNIGYIAGYCHPTEMQRIHRVTGTKHPVFGTHIPSPSEALDAGKRLGESMLEGRTRND